MSAWGDSWGNSWGNSWGSITVPETQGGSNEISLRDLMDYHDMEAIKVIAAAILAINEL